MTATNHLRDAQINLLKVLVSLREQFYSSGDGDIVMHPIELMNISRLIEDAVFRISEARANK